MSIYGWLNYIILFLRLFSKRETKTCSRINCIEGVHGILSNTIYQKTGVFELHIFRSFPSLVFQTSDGQKTPEAQRTTLFAIFPATKSFGHQPVCLAFSPLEDEVMQILEEHNMLFKFLLKFP